MEACLDALLDSRVSLVLGRAVLVVRPALQHSLRYAGDAPSSWRGLRPRAFHQFFVLPCMGSTVGLLGFGHQPPVDGAGTTARCGIQLREI